MAKASFSRHTARAHVLKFPLTGYYIEVSLRDPAAVGVHKPAEPCARRGKDTSLFGKPAGSLVRKATGSTRKLLS